jgi:RNA polymerase sigma factor (sigma-70 family)
MRPGSIIELRGIGLIELEDLPVSSEGSVTKHVRLLKKGDQSAARPLWQRYFPWLVRLARRKLRSTPNAVADEEDVALDAFARFCRRAEEGRLPEIRTRDDLWRLLVTMTVRMAIDEVRRQHRQKRGGATRAAEDGLPAAALSSEALVSDVASREAPPDFILEVAEECERLLDGLKEDDLKVIAVWKSEGCTNEEVAARLGVVLRTVERKLHVIRERWADDAPVPRPDRHATQ